MRGTLTFAAACALVASTSFAAYVVLLKNGNRVVAREKYTIKGANAIVTLKNGTLTSIPLSQVNIEGTDRLNARRLGDATPLDALDRDEAPPPTATPTPSMSRLGRLRNEIGRPEGDAAKPTPTPGISYREAHFKDVKVEQAFQEGLERYHIYLYRTSVGTRPSMLFVEISVSGQPEVLKSLQSLTTTYQLLVQSAPDRAPEAVEVQMINESGKEAGVFRITPADAAELTSGKVTPEEFFVKHVIF